MEGLSCTVEQRADATLVQVSGEVDIANAGKLRKVLIEVLGATPSTHLVVDLSGVSFIDSTGIGVIAGAQRRATAQGGRLTAVVTHTAVRRVLQTTGLMQNWHVTESVEQALEN